MTADTQSLSERLRSVGKSLGSAIAGYRDEDNKRCASALVELGTMSWDAADALDAKEAEIERLRAVRDVADLLVNECEGGRTPPSLGILAQLESALAMEHKTRAIT